jgi:hypothetical protein
MKMLDGTASSFRWMLASLLAVHGGALVALMQAGVDKHVMASVGWYFVAGLALSLLAGLASWWAMVLTFMLLGNKDFHDIMHAPDGQEDATWCFLDAHVRHSVHAWIFYIGASRICSSSGHDRKVRTVSSSKVLEPSATIV